MAGQSVEFGAYSSSARALIEARTSVMKQHYVKHPDERIILGQAIAQKQPNVYDIYKSIIEPDIKGLRGSFNNQGFSPGAVMAYGASRAQTLEVQKIHDRFTETKTAVESRGFTGSVPEIAGDLMAISLAHRKDEKKVVELFTQLQENKRLQLDGIQSPQALSMLTALSLLAEPEAVVQLVDDILVNSTHNWQDDEAVAMMAVASFVNRGDYQTVLNEYDQLPNWSGYAELGINGFMDKSKVMFLIAEHIGGFSPEQSFDFFSELKKEKKSSDWEAIRMLVSLAAVEKGIGLTTQSHQEKPTGTVTTHVNTPMTVIPIPGSGLATTTQGGILQPIQVGNVTIYNTISAPTTSYNTQDTSPSITLLLLEDPSQK